MDKYNYYYHVGQYLLSAGERNPYSFHGSDVRSWIFTGERKQITKEEYEQIVVDEAEIIKELKSKYGVTRGFHHYPIRVLKEEDENTI